MNHLIHQPMLALPAPRRRRRMDSFQIGDQVTFQWTGKIRIGWVASRHIIHWECGSKPLELLEVKTHDDGDIGWFNPSELRTTKHLRSPWTTDGPHSTRISLGKTYICMAEGLSAPWTYAEVKPFALTPKGYRVRLAPSDNRFRKLTPYKRLCSRVFPSTDLW